MLVQRPRTKPRSTITQTTLAEFTKQQQRLLHYPLESCWGQEVKNKQVCRKYNQWGNLSGQGAKFKGTGWWLMALGAQWICVNADTNSAVFVQKEQAAEIDFSCLEQNFCFVLICVKANPVWSQCTRVSNRC